MTLFDVPDLISCLKHVTNTVAYMLIHTQTHTHNTQTDRQTGTHTHTHTHRHTHTHEHLFNPLVPCTLQFVHGINYFLLKVKQFSIKNQQTLQLGLVSSMFPPKCPCLLVVRGAVVKCKRNESVCVCMCVPHPTKPCAPEVLPIPPRSVRQ